MEQPSRRSNRMDHYHALRQVTCDHDRVGDATEGSGCGRQREITAAADKMGATGGRRHQQRAIDDVDGDMVPGIPTELLEHRPRRQSTGAIKRGQIQQRQRLRVGRKPLCRERRQRRADGYWPW